jgi:hypothetical protein
VNATIEIRELAATSLVELDHLAALFAICLLLPELLREAPESRACCTPYSSQLEVDECVYSDLRIA